MRFLFKILLNLLNLYKIRIHNPRKSLSETNGISEQTGWKRLRETLEIKFSMAAI